MQTGTSNENTMADWARTNNVEYKPVVIEQFNEVVNAFAAGRCDVFTTDASGFASIRISNLTKPDDYQVLPVFIFTAPLGPFVRPGGYSLANVWRVTLQGRGGAE